MATIVHPTTIDIATYPDDPAVPINSAEWNANHTLTLGADENFVTAAQLANIHASGSDPELTADELAAVQGADNPSATRVFDIKPITYTLAPVAPAQVSATMVANDDPAPNVISASEEDSPAWGAWDGTAAVWETWSIPLPHWNKYDFGSALYAANMITIQAGGSGFEPYAPKDFIIQGSNNDADWTDLSTQTGITFTADESKSYVFANTTAYRYYRIYITAVGNDDPNRVTIGDMSLWTVPVGTHKDRPYNLGDNLETELYVAPTTNIPIYVFITQSAVLGKVNIYNSTAGHIYIGLDGDNDVNYPSVAYVLTEFNNLRGWRLLNYKGMYIELYGFDSGSGGPPTIKYWQVVKPATQTADINVRWMGSRDLKSGWEERYALNLAQHTPVAALAASTALPPIVLGAETASAGTGPIKFDTAGVPMTVPEAGVMGPDGETLTYTVPGGGTPARKTIAFLESPTFTGITTVADGSAAAPSLRFTSDADSGFYYNAKGFGYAVDGASKILLDSSGNFNAVKFYSASQDVLYASSNIGYLFSGPINGSIIYGGGGAGSTRPQIHLTTNGANSAASGTGILSQIFSVWNTSGTAGTDDLRIKRWDISGGGSGSHYFINAGISTDGTNFTSKFIVTRTGALALGGASSSAILTLPAGTATASTGPLKFTQASAVLVTSPEAGLVEVNDGDDIFYTIKTGTARKGIILNDGTNLTATRVPFATTNGRLTDDADLTFSGDTLTATKLVVPTEARFGDTTNKAVFDADGDLTFAGTARMNWTKITAASVNITTGGTDASSVVANLQTENDGNIFHLDEAAATPGSDFYVEFTSVTAFNWVHIRASYVGSGTHAMGILLYDWVAGAWKHKICMQDMVYDTTAQQEVMCNESFFVPSDTNFIGTGGDAGKVRIRFVHPMAGDGSHDVYIDVVALYQ